VEDILYLDTARVGRPSPRTLQAGTDSLLMAAYEGGSAYFDRFLRNGLADCPTWMSTRYRGLQSWRGITALKEDLRTLVGGPPDFPVLLANRSAQLMNLAARLFFLRCRNALTCDLGWPAYQEILERTTSLSEVKVTLVPLHQMVFEGNATADDVIDAVVKAYLKNQCDGLFLPAVSNLGVRIPIEQIVRQIEAKYEVRLVVIDGAQEFSQIGANLVADYCDLYLAGCHKWLAGHHPMGVAFFGRGRSRGLITTMLNQMLAANMLDDPLLHYTQRIETGHNDQYTETVNLSSLFTCQAAVTEANHLYTRVSGLQARLTNRQLIRTLLPETGWHEVAISPTLQSAILLAKPERNIGRSIESAELREAFRSKGVGLTAYPNCRVRLAMPDQPMEQTEPLHRLAEAFRAIA
jgi:hypothetical protein